ESMLTPRKLPFLTSSGYGAGALSQFMPEDLAIRYGKQLGLECEPGCWPAAEPRTGATSVSDTNQPVCAVGSDAINPGEISAKIRSSEEPERQVAIAALFELIESEGALIEVLDECLTLLQDGGLRPEEVVPWAPALLAIWNSAHAELKSRQQETVSA